MSSPTHYKGVALISSRDRETYSVFLPLSLSLAPPSPLSFTNILPLTSGPLADSSSCVVCVYKRGGLGFEVGQVSGSSHCVNLIISRFWAWLCFTVITTAWFRSSKSAPSQWCLFANIRNLEGLIFNLISLFKWKSHMKCKSLSANFQLFSSLVSLFLPVLHKLPNTTHSQPHPLLIHQRLLHWSYMKWFEDLHSESRGVFKMFKGFKKTVNVYFFLNRATDSYYLAPDVYMPTCCSGMLN